MFAIHRTDPRKTVHEAEDAALMHASMFMNGNKPVKDMQDRAGRLYDLHFFLIQIRENLAGQQLGADRADRVRRICQDVERCLLWFFYDVGDSRRIAATFEGIDLLLRHASGRSCTCERQAHRIALANCHWLQNLAHNAHLDWKWAKDRGC